MGTSCWAINLPIWQINRLMLATFWPNISPLALQEVSCPPTFVPFFGRFFPDRRFHYPIDKVPMVWPPQSWVFYTCDRSPRSLGDSLWPVQNPALRNVITFTNLKVLSSIFKLNQLTSIVVPKEFGSLSMIRSSFSSASFLLLFSKSFELRKSHKS